MFGRLPTTSIQAGHLEAFQVVLSEAYNADSIRKHVVSAHFLFNRAVRAGWLPSGFRPFASVEPVKVESKPLHEADLMTDEEVEALFEWADADLTPINPFGTFMRRESCEWRTGDENPWRGFEGMLSPC